MNILILGNGFDAAHGLLTNYKDFLYIVEAINKFYDMTKPEERQRCFSELCSKLNSIHDGDVKWQEAYIKKDFKQYGILELLQKMSLKMTYSTQEMKKINSLTKENFWLEYFIYKNETINNKWIDFEKEIKEVCQNIEAIIYNTEKSIERNQYIYLKYPTFYSESSFVNTRDTLKKDLDKFTSAFEIYIHQYINNDLCLNLSNDIYELDIQKVISFNYSNTFERLYDYKNSSIQYDYIHGMASDIIKKSERLNNIVLGFDEYLSDDIASSKNNFLEFKKFYQRVLKNTDNSYFEWVEEIISYRENNYDITDYLYIYGHSLDITDGDILKKLILNSNVKTTIFYYKDKDKEEKISNLIKILGYNDFLFYTGSNRIKFIKSTKLISEEEVIANNIIKVAYNFNNISSFEYQVIIEQINKEIVNIKNGEKKDYYTKIIPVFDALFLYTKKNINIEILNTIKMLPNNYLLDKNIRYGKFECTSAEEYLKRCRDIFAPDTYNDLIFDTKICEMIDEIIKPSISNGDRIRRLLKEIGIQYARINYIVSEQNGELDIHLKDNYFNEIMDKIYKYIDKNNDVENKYKECGLLFYYIQKNYKETYFNKHRSLLNGKDIMIDNKFISTNYFKLYHFINIYNRIPNM